MELLPTIKLLPLLLSLLLLRTLSCSYAQTETETPTPTPSSAAVSFTGGAYLSISNSSHPLVVDLSSNNSTTKSSKIYIPVNTNSASTTCDQYNELPSVPMFDTALTLKLQLNPGTSAKSYYYVAIPSGSGDTYTVVAGGTSAATESSYTEPETNIAYSIAFTLYDLTQSGKSSINFSATTNGGEVSQSQTLYIFTADTNPESFSISSDSEYAGGVYLELRFSNYYESAGIPLISSVGVGDRKLHIAYTTGNIGKLTATFHKTILLTYPTTQEDLPYKKALDLAHNQTPNTSSDQMNGQIIASNLENNTSYHAAVGIVNKYRFVSRLSRSKEGTPKELEMLLTERGCLMKAASVPQNAPIYALLRLFRDRYLLTTAFGREIVNFYYNFSQVVAPYIMKNHSLAEFIRTSSALFTSL
ncbi:MAG: hypothetical protein HQK50_00275 [Oligoflexia bacterium]|nr:hypothetical protein [Oligoflexia bacterium]